jgi:hypothetical protein
MPDSSRSFLSCRSSEQQKRHTAELHTPPRSPAVAWVKIPTCPRVRQVRRRRAVLTVPYAHVVMPEGAYPDVHVIRHCPPEASELLQLPDPPFCGVAEASQGEGSQAASVKSPDELHEEPPLGLSTKPESH